MIEYNACGVAAPSSFPSPHLVYSRFYACRWFDETARRCTNHVAMVRKP